MEFKLIDKEKAFTIISVNTTIISLIAACIFAYAVFINTTIQNAELKAFDEVSKINDILFEVHNCPYILFDQDDFNNRENLFKRVHFFSFFGWIVEMKNDEEYVDSQLNELSLKKDTFSLGQRALGVMGCIAGQYPFPNLFKKNKKNEYSLGRELSEPIIFSDLDDIRLWVKSMNEILNTYRSEFRGDGFLLDLLTDFSKSDHFLKLKDNFSKSGMVNRMILKPMVRGVGRPFFSKKSMDPISVYHDYMNGMYEVKDIVWSTNNYIKNVDALTKRYPSKSSLSFILFLIFLAFGFGVIYPLITEKVKRVFVLWLPLGIYMIIGIVIL